MTDFVLFYLCLFVELDMSATNFDFDPIARRYDLCNHLFSLGLDRRWRRLTVRALRPGAGDRVLDLCCGTGDLVFAFARHSPAQSITGLDLSEAMLGRAREKTTPALKERLGWIGGDAAATGLADEAFDIVTCAFGLRNMPDRLAALREMRRLLRPGGRAAILEFSLPKSPLLRGPYLFYLRTLMPLGGRLLFVSRGPLDYLADSIMEWSRQFDLPRAAAEAGLEHLSRRSMTGGIVMLDILQRRP